MIVNVPRLVYVMSCSTLSGTTRMGKGGNSRKSFYEYQREGIIINIITIINYLLIIFTVLKKD